MFFVPDGLMRRPTPPSPVWGGDAKMTPRELMIANLFRMRYGMSYYECDDKDRNALRSVVENEVTSLLGVLSDNGYEVRKRDEELTV